MNRPRFNEPSASSDYSNVAPPKNINKRKGYNALGEDQDFSVFQHRRLDKRRLDNDDSYWDQEDEDDQKGKTETGNHLSEDDEEEDPLDAFMAGIEKEVKKTEKKVDVKKDKEVSSNIRMDIEGEEDVQESYYRYMKENPKAGLDILEDEDDELAEYDEEGNLVVNRKKLRHIDPLPPIDHSTIQYSNFERNFYVEHEEIKTLDDEKVQELRRKLGITVLGMEPPKPCSSFGHFGFDENLTKAVIKMGYSQPTPIQCQAVPVAMSGRDILGIAKTGSGKTAAYLWPMLIHIMDQSELKSGQGPIGLILAPTRELTQQIHSEAKKFAKAYGLKVACCFGGGSKWEQSKDLQDGAEIVVATPGRMIDLIKSRATNLERVTMLVLDEADRMFDMGFGAQIMSICNHVRPDRQTLLFSATFKRRVERLAREVLTDPIKIIQGEVGVANEDVTQIVMIMKDGPSKWAWLTSHMVQFTSNGSVLIFVTRKANSEELANNLKSLGIELVLIHGDMNQIDRNNAIGRFKRKEIEVMVATDVAARGLDITHVKTVINYDVARDIDTHTHRIGRTGRAGDKDGIAYTLVTETDKDFAGHLVRNLEGANQNVPEDLMSLAMQSTWFAKSRFKRGKGRKSNNNYSRVNTRSRPGLGASEGHLRDDNNSSHSSRIHHPSSSDPSKSNQSDRIAVMRDAFRAQFQASFRPATDNEMSGRESSKSSTPDNPKSARKKSRWE